MAEEAIPSAADPLQSRVPPTRLPSLAELYTAQQLGQSLHTNSYTLPELYALEQTGAPLDLASSPDTNLPQKSQSPAPQDQSLPILADQSGAPLQPEPLTPGERIGGAARTVGQALTGGRSDYLEAEAKTLLGWQPQSIQAHLSADQAFHEGKPGKVQSQQGATFDDHLADIQAASQRFGWTHPEQATAAQVVPLLLAGFGTTGLLARMLSGERLIGTTAARVAPEMVAPLAHRLGPELADSAVPASAAVATKAESSAGSATSPVEPATAHILAATEPTVAAESIARPPAEPDGRYYSVLRQVKLEPKPQGTGRRRHNREANEIVLREKESDPEAVQQLKDLGVHLERTPTGLAPDEPPPDHTWHHYTWDEGAMHLMPRWQHEAKEFQKVLHPLPRGGGGYKLWGDKFVQIPGATTGMIWSTQHPRDPANSAQQDEDN
jgi:hypothetical protein